MSDADLLRRFTDTREVRAGEAFEALVDRHGGMVLRVCRSVLGSEHDALDAFQATFLVLVRRASSLRLEGSLAPWLHGVALRTASYARRSSRVRRKHESRWFAFFGRSSVEDELCDDLSEILQREIALLPLPFREAVLTVDLEGLTQEQAAQRLGRPLGTLQSRLARGRAKLRARLEGRGFTGVVPSLGSIAVPKTIIEGLVAGRASATVKALSNIMTRHLLMSKLKTILTATLLLLGAVSGALGYGAWKTRSANGDPFPETSRNKPSTLRKDQPTEAGDLTKASNSLVKLKRGDYLKVEVLQALMGRPLSTLSQVREDGTFSLGWYGDITVAGLDRNQIKTAVIERMKRFLNDEALGLVDHHTEGEPGEEIKVDPLDSTYVYVEDSPNLDVLDPQRMEKIEKMLVDMAEEIQSLKTMVAKLNAPKRD